MSSTTEESATNEQMFDNYSTGMEKKIISKSEFGLTHHDIGQSLSSIFRNFFILQFFQMKKS